MVRCLSYGFYIRYRKESAGFREMGGTDGTTAVPNSHGTGTMDDLELFGTVVPLSLCFCGTAQLYCGCTES